MKDLTSPPASSAPVKIEISDDTGRVENYEAPNKAAADGLLKYLDRRPWIDGFTLTRIYLNHLRLGVDLNTLPMPERSPEQLGLLNPAS